jgi:dTDP-4-dehydrorhamnose reductase
VANYDPHLVDRRERPGRRRLTSAFAECGPGSRTRPCGFRSREADTLAEALEQLCADLIINPAAYTAVDRAEDEPELAFRVNSEAPAVMAGWAARRNVPLIHFSTDFVFDGQGEKPWKEDSTTRPLSVYGESKLAGEAAIRAAAGPHIVVRTSWVYAAKGINFMRTIVRLAGERKELRIVADQIGAPRSARTIADAVVQIIGPDILDTASGTAFGRQIINVAVLDKPVGMVLLPQSSPVSRRGVSSKSSQSERKIIRAKRPVPQIHALILHVRKTSSA